MTTQTSLATDLPQTYEEANLANYRAILADFMRDEQDAENRMVADDERRAEEEAFASDPDYIAYLERVDASMDAERASIERLAEEASAAVDGCPWCTAANTGPAILALFAAAPKMKALYLPGPLKISRAGLRSSNPSGLWITDGGSYGESEYYGSIRTDGSMRMTRAWAAVGGNNALKRLAAFGPSELARVGRATGICCYCGRFLTDPVSVALGYGPVCAGYHGLPHNAAAVVAATEKEVAA